MSNTEYLPICDRRNRPVGRARRDVVHAQGLVHRAVHILVFNEAGEVFLQHRGPGKDTHPGKWDTSVGGHVDADERPGETVHRELAEELSLSGEPTWIGSHLPCVGNGLEYVDVFTLVTRDSPRWDGVEITDGRWWNPEALERAMGEGELTTTPSFQMTWGFWRAAALVAGTPDLCMP